MSRSSAVATQGAWTAIGRYRRRLATVTVALLLLCAGENRVLAATQSPPDLMTYQGFLTDANGSALGGATTGPQNFTVVFRIYNVSTGGSSLWSESQVVTVDKGNFSVLLGQGAAVGSEPHAALNQVFIGSDASDRYIEMTVTVNSTVSPISPRLHLVTSPYSMLAKTAIGLYANDGSAVQNINGTSIATGTVSDARLSSNVALKNAANSFSAQQTFTSGAAFNSVAITSSVDLNMPNNTVNAKILNGYGSVPLGAIVMWSGDSSTIPVNWALCDGLPHGTQNRSTPDLRGRFIIGAGPSYGVRTTGGASTVTLSVYNLPAHTHGYQDRFFIEHNIGDDAGVGTLPTPNNASLTGSGDTDHDNKVFEYIDATTGNGNNCNNNAFSIVPPYYALYYIMRVD